MTHPNGNEGDCMEKIKYRSIFVSDVHLGTKDARSEYLLDLLLSTESEFLYLVGDIFDLWKLRSGWYWPQINNHIVQIVLAKARSGTKVIFIPGNHDSLLRDYMGMIFNGVHIQNEALHLTADGRRLLVSHGDELDGPVAAKRWLRLFGTLNYSLLLCLNRYVNGLRGLFGLPYWSLSRYVKSRVKNAMEYVARFEQAAIDRARSAQVDGMLCGHIHVANMKRIDGILYVNAGDWVENCTAVTEDRFGSLRLVHWVEDSVYLMQDRDAGACVAEPNPNSCVARQDEI